MGRRPNGSAQDCLPDSQPDSLPDCPPGTRTSRERPPGAAGPAFRRPRAAPAGARRNCRRNSLMRRCPIGAPPGRGRQDLARERDVARPGRVVHANQCRRGAGLPRPTDRRSLRIGRRRSPCGEDEPRQARVPACLVLPIASGQGRRNAKHHGALEPACCRGRSVPRPGGQGVAPSERAWTPECRTWQAARPRRHLGPGAAA